MPGMNSGLSDTNPTLVAAFRAALLHQGLVLILLAALALTWLAAREFAPRTPAGRWSRWRAGDTARPEPPGRRLLRIGFGVIWIFDGLLQAPPAMRQACPARSSGRPRRPHQCGCSTW